MSITDDSLFCAASCLFGEIQKLVPERCPHFMVVSRPGAANQGMRLKMGNFVSYYNNAVFGPG